MLLIFPWSRKNHFKSFTTFFLQIPTCLCLSRLYVGTYSVRTFQISWNSWKRRSSFCTRKLFKLGNLSKMFSVSLSTKNSHEIWFCAMTIYNNILVLYSKKSAIFFKLNQNENPRLNDISIISKWHIILIWLKL